MGYWRFKMWGGGYVLILMYKIGFRFFRYLLLVVGFWEEVFKGFLDFGKIFVVIVIVVVDEIMVGINDG